MNIKKRGLGRGLDVLLGENKIPENNNLTAFRLKDFKELINCSYIPVTKAIVPPDTPGITLAAPIPKPLRSKIK